MIELSVVRGLTSRQRRDATQAIRGGDSVALIGRRKVLYGAAMDVKRRLPDVELATSLMPRGDALHVCLLRRKGAPLEAVSYFPRRRLHT